MKSTTYYKWCGGLSATAASLALFSALEGPTFWGRTAIGFAALLMFLVLALTVAAGVGQ